MNTIRSGKIARLPAAIREELNQRLANHESSGPLLAWLNALPEVRAVLAQEFGGEGINKMNISNWRQGGLAEWQGEQAVREIMKELHADGNELTQMADGSVVNLTAQWLAARYAVAMKQAQGQGGDPAAAWNRMRQFCHDIVALQRGEQRTQRLALERGRAELAGRKLENRGLRMGGGPHGPSAGARGATRPTSHEQDNGGIPQWRDRTGNAQSCGGGTSAELQHLTPKVLAEGHLE